MESVDCVSSSAQARAGFGPEVKWIGAIDCAVDPKRAESFRHPNLLA
jgi:hypothetical protein